MKKIINKNTIIAFIIGVFTFGVVNISAAFLYSSNQITYNHEGTDITLKQAIDGLYDISSTNNLMLIAQNITAVDTYGVYASTTIDVKSFIQNNNISYDYTKLTVDDFLLVVARGEFSTNSKNSAPSFAPQITNYNQTTGVLTIGNISYAWNPVVNNGYCIVKYYVNIYIK